MIKTDVLIIGGGPSGSACAWKLKKNGADCLILDQSSFPRFKPCGGWIPPELIRDLEINPSDYPYGFTTFTSFVISVRGFTFNLPTRQYAIRRYEFDEWLLRRSGVPLQIHTVKSIQQVDGGFVIDDTYFCKYLVGAGGTHCPVYRSLFQDAPDTRGSGSLVIAMEDEFPYPAADQRCHLWFLENQLPGYSWYVPKANGYLNIGIGGMANHLKNQGDQLRKHWDKLTQKLESLKLVTGCEFKPKGHSYYLRQKASETRRGNAFIVGDAAGLATVDMGEGIRPAVESGLLAANAIIHGSDYSTSTIPTYSWPSITRLPVFKKRSF